MHYPLPGPNPGTVRFARFYKPLTLISGTLAVPMHHCTPLQLTRYVHTLLHAGQSGKLATKLALEGPQLAPKIQPTCSYVKGGFEEGIKWQLRWC